ncbi:MAG TPA: hypothetical protein VLX68_10940 [Chitinivibrionales bacterium]|nr:hypothetical protein [Chitinivibrionales bacterium]
MSARSLIIPILLLTSLDICASDTLSYRFFMGRDTALSTCIITKSGKSETMYSDWRAETASVASELMIDSTGIERSWKSSNAWEGTRVAVVRSGDSLLLSGIFRKKPVAKSYALKGAAWKQMIPFDLADFAFSNNTSLVFQTVALMGPYPLKTAQMQVKRIGEETIVFKGEKTAAVHVRASPTGIFAALWHANYWFRKSDGVLVRSESTGIPGRPGAAMELTGKK